jgi:hypothetical protein
MSFIKQQHASGMIGLVLVGIAAAVIVRVTLAGGFANYFEPSRSIDSAVIAQLRNVPGNATLLERLEEDFPDQHDDFVAMVGAAARAEGSDDRVMIAAGQWINRFFEAHARDFAAAPRSSLEAVIAAEHDYVASLQRSDEITCGAVVTGTPLDRPLPEALEAKAGKVVAEKIAAIKAGRVDQQMRLAPTPNDREALLTELQARGLNDAQLEVLAGEADPGSISKPMACEMALAFLSAIRAQPEGRRELLIGTMM